MRENLCHLVAPLQQLIAEKPRHGLIVLNYDEIDELDRLREKSARTSSSLDELEESGSGIGGWFNRLTPVRS